jgi:anti-sigma-K factor RskA
VFKRYSIVNPNDTAVAVRKVDARRQRDLATVANAQTSETHLAEFEQKMAETAPQSLQTANSARRNRKAAGLPN